MAYKLSFLEKVAEIASATKQFEHGIYIPCERVTPEDVRHVLNAIEYEKIVTGLMHLSREVAFPHDEVSCLES